MLPWSGLRFVFRSWSSQGILDLSPSSSLESLDLGTLQDLGLWWFSWNGPIRSNLTAQSSTSAIYIAHGWQDWPLANRTPQILQSPWALFKSWHFSYYTTIWSFSLLNKGPLHPLWSMHVPSQLYVSFSELSSIQCLQLCWVLLTLLSFVSIRSSLCFILYKECLELLYSSWGLGESYQRKNSVISESNSQHKDWYSQPLPTMLHFPEE